jgi:hypothetical protein
MDYLIKGNIFKMDILRVLFDTERMEDLKEEEMIQKVKYSHC